MGILRAKPNLSRLSNSAVPEQDVTPSFDTISFGLIGASDDARNEKYRRSVECILSPARRPGQHVVKAELDANTDMSGMLVNVRVERRTAITEVLVTGLGVTALETAKQEFGACVIKAALKR